MKTMNKTFNHFWQNSSSNQHLKAYQFLHKSLLPLGRPTTFS